jgi:uncharacterized membrane protein YfcA
MDIVFPVSGVETQIWLPPLVAFVISYFVSMAGLSGAFLLLPFQMSVLGFTSPAVSPTNLVFNVVAIPSGVVRYVREGRMVWPLTWVVVAGTVPGIVAGGFVRLRCFPDPLTFKAFVGCVLLYLAIRMVLDVVRSRRGGAPAPPPTPEELTVRTVAFGLRHLVYEFQGVSYRCSVPGIFLLSLAVGVVGGIYGIGGGAIIAPFFVAIYRLPVHTVAGATLMGTFVTSVVGVVFFQIIAPWYAGQSVAPDWLLGGLFGLGGLVGMYAGARTQRHVPALWIKVMIGLVLLYVSGSYLCGFFLGR